MSFLALLALAQATTPDGSLRRGLGHFTLDVIGSETVAGRDAVEATTDQRKIRYQIGKTDRAELGYHHGGDCSAIQPR